MRFSPSAGLLAFASVASAAATWNYAIGDKVKTSSGNIQGRASTWKPKVSEYLGIPFAEPPVNELRWAAPKAYKSNKDFVATKFSPSCPANVLSPPKTLANGTSQNILGALAQVGDTFSEDCLTLNVWTKPQSGEKSKAVLVYIYGGGYTTGNSGNPSYNGARLADENDIVVVSFNYRLNIFGFPSVDFVPERNLGLLDQRLAVEWVRDNIAAFGGDPKRIVLAGQSAGAASVDLYSYAWSSDPIVSGFIEQSGTATSFPTPYENAAAWFRVSIKLGCGGDNTTAASLQCMKTKSAVEILDAVKTTRTSSTEGIGMGIGEFTPTIDDKLVFSDVTSRRSNGNFARKPLLVGSNNNEAGLFAVLGPLIAVASPSNSSSARAGKGGLGNLRSNPSLINGQFTCPAADTAKGRKDNGVPVWRYRYKGEFPNSAIGPDAGAYHGAEVALVFGTTEYVSKDADVAEEVALGQKIRKAWTDFVKDPVKGLTLNGTNWPPYDPTGNALVQLGGANSSAVEFLPSGQFDSQCALVRLATGGKGGGGGLGGLIGGLGGLFGGGAPKGNGTRTGGGGGGFGGLFGGAPKGNGTRTGGGKGAGGGGGFGGLFGGAAPKGNGTRTGGKAGGGGGGKGKGKGGAPGGFNFGGMLGAKGSNATRNGGGGAGGGKGFQFPKSTNATRGGGGKLGGGFGGGAGGGLGGLGALLGGGNLGGLLSGLFGGGGDGGGGLGALLGGLDLGGLGKTSSPQTAETAAPKGYNATRPEGLRPLMIRKIVT